MSDVPATAWWLLAWIFAVRSGRWQAFASGLPAVLLGLIAPSGDRAAAALINDR
jgi:hypothetical protein